MSERDVVRMRKTRKKLPCVEVSHEFSILLHCTHNSEPGEQHVDRLIRKLDKEENLPQERVMTPEDLVKVGQRVHCSEERSVQPPSPLQDKVGHLSRHVRLSSRGLDILQDPRTIPLADELPAENTIFGEIHVGGENARIRTMHLLSGKVLVEWSLASLVILQGDKSVR